MATYGHTLPGPSLGSKKVIAKDILSNGATAVVELEQPKDTIIDMVIIRILDDITVASDVDISFQVGTTSSGSDIVAPNAQGILEGGDALTVKKNNVFKFNPVAGTAGFSQAATTDGDG